MTRNLDASILFGEFAESHAAEIANSVPVGIAICDQSGTLQFINAELARLTGYGAEELLGRPVQTLLPDRYHGRHAAQREVFSKAPVQHSVGSSRDLTGRRKDGREFPVEIGLSSVERGSDGLHLRPVVAAIREERSQ